MAPNTNGYVVSMKWNDSQLHLLLIVILFFSFTDYDEHSSVQTKHFLDVQQYTLLILIEARLKIHLTI